MAEKKFFVDINLQGSALTNAKIGTNSGIGSTEGAFGYDSTAHRLQYFDGTATKEVANLSDISAVTGGLIFQGGYDPTTDTPNITDGSALKGFFWAATAAGTFLGESVQVGDSIVAKVDNAGATIADWLILQGNIVIATDSVDGISRLATQTEANDGTEGGAVVITPATLQGKIDDQVTPAINSKVSKSGDTMSGNLDMANNSITGANTINSSRLEAPFLAGGDKNYTGAINVVNNLDFGNNGSTITNLPIPTADGDATNKEYVDTAASTVQANAEATASADATAKADAAEANANAYTDTGLAAKLNLAGGTMTGAINMNNHYIDGVSNINVGIVNADSLNSNTVVDPIQVASDLNLNNGRTIKGLPAPTDNGDAANKEYVDTSIANTKFNEFVPAANWSLNDGAYTVTLTHNLSSYGILFSAMNLYHGTFDEFSFKALGENAVEVRSNILPTEEYLFSILKTYTQG